MKTANFPGIMAGTKGKQAKTAKVGKPKKDIAAIAGEKPRQKHAGNLGTVMRGAFNSNKMAKLRGLQK